MQMIERFALYSLTKAAEGVGTFVLVRYAKALLYKIWAFDTWHCTMSNAIKAESLVTCFIDIRYILISGCKDTYNP